MGNKISELEKLIVELETACDDFDEIALDEQDFHLQVAYRITVNTSKTALQGYAE